MSETKKDDIEITTRQGSEGSASDPEWWPGIVAMLAEAEGFLTFHGYPTRGEGFDALLLWDWEDGESPIDTAVPADVVAAARALEAASTVTYALAHDESAALPVVMFILGEEFLRFEILKTTPGLATEVATRNDGLPSLFQFVSENAGKELLRKSRMKEGLEKQLEKRKEGLKPRNKTLCDLAKRHRDNGVDDRNLTAITLRTFNQRGAIAERHGGWTKITTTKQVMTILRKGGVLPPAKSKIGKSVK